MATIEQYKAALMQADAKGDKEAAQLFANKVKEMQASDYSNLLAEAQPQQGVGETILGAGEAGLGLTSAALLEPVAGLAGIAGSVLPGEQGQGAEWVQNVRGAAYQPRTDAGQGAMQGAQQFIQPLAEGIQATEGYLGDAAMNLTGSPAVAAAATAIPTAAMEALGYHGAKNVGTGAARRGQQQSAQRQQLVDEPQQPVPQGFNPDDIEQLRRQQLFEELNIPTTESRITQQPIDFLTERRLNRDAESDIADKLRERLSDESAAFRDSAQKLADDLGIPEESGALIKDALESRYKQTKQSVGDAYKELAALSEGEGIPLSGRNIIETVNNDKTFADMMKQIEPAEKAKLNDLMVEYGVNQDQAARAKWLQKASATAESSFLPVKSDITPLNVLNHSDLTKDLNALLSFDSPPGIRAVVGKLKDGVKKEVSEVKSSLESMSAGERGALGNKSLDSANAALRAINEFKDFKGEFSAGDLVQKLTSKKKGTFDRDLILNEHVVKDLLATSKVGAVSDVSKVVDSLMKSGDVGKKALGSLQSSVVMDLMNSALKRTSGKLEGGVRDWSGTNFINRLNQIGPEKMQVVFKNNPEGLKRINKIRDAGELKIPFEQIAQASGTADDLLNSLKGNPDINRLFTAMGGVKGWAAAQALEGAAGQMKKRAQKRKLRKALKASPVLKQNFQQFKNQYPELATALGLGAITTVGTKEDD
jgi:hypothetical protein